MLWCRARRIEPARILVVDENERQARRICRYLEGLHRPISHSEATQLGLSGSMVDLMIVSLSNEKLDGLRLCAYFRSLESTRDLPILVIAEPDDEKKAVRALDLGASDIVIKPIDPEELSARVKTQVRKKRYLDALRARLDQSMELAVTDQLTGLHNRRYMRVQLESFVKRSNMGGMPVSVLLCDIDHFKKVNDIHGHSAGDDVLREFGRRLRDNIRPMDLACRYGGEEFVVIMPETTQGLAHAAGERLRADHGRDALHDRPGRPAPRHHERRRRHRHPAGRHRRRPDEARRRGALPRQGQRPEPRRSRGNPRGLIGAPRLNLGYTPP